VPLMLEGWTAAILWFDKIEPNFYTSVHAERLALFAGQASLALRNAQLFAETSAALEREQQLGEITRAISSELDLATILPQVTRLAVELSGAEAGSMSILDETDQLLRYPYLHNLPRELNQEMDQRGESVAWEIIESRQPLLLASYADHPKANPRWVKAGVRAFLGVPVIVGTTCLGSLSVMGFDPEKVFGPREQSLVELVGRQAAVAIQNARLFEAARRRAAEAETLRQAASAVSSDLELDQVLNKILDQLASVVPYDSAAIFLFENEQLRIKASRGFANPSALDSRFSAQNSLIQIIDTAKEAVILEDAQSDPRFTPSPDTEHIHGWIGLPLRVRDVSIGFLTVDSRQVGAYVPADASLAQAFADEVAIAIENARLFKQIQHLAITDPLTGLYNRHYFFEAAPREFEHARRYQTPLSIIIFDLDRFKRVNDTYGHIAGDQVLASVAQRSRQSLREVDIIARYGGEEFIVLLPQTNLEGARLLANRLRERIVYPPVDAGGQHIPISASLGVATLDETCTNLQELVRRADAALYATKRTSRGSISIWTVDMD
jgi:diguanylate cyclase (GGDEF)-like protein